jgi:spore coat protein U-like protein
MFRAKLTRFTVLAAAAATFIGAPLLATAATYSNGTNTATFDVTIKIVANCIIAANNLDFGQSQGVLNTAVNVNSTLSVTCSNTTPYNVGLNAGSGTGSVGTTRFMSSLANGATNTATIAFNLFQTNGATVWGNTQGTNTLGGTGNGNAQTLTVYGNVPPQTTPMPDSYRSTITATVYF